MPLHSSKSFWIHECGDYEPNSTLNHELVCDVLVIGGGIAGLSAAWHLRRDEPSLDVALIESEIIGFGASGRASGWVMSQFGMNQFAIQKRYGIDRSQEAYAYCRRAMEYTRELIETHNLDSDYRHPGVMRVAFDDRWVDDLHDLMDLFVKFGMTDVRWLDAADLATEYADNPNFRAAIFDPNMGLIQPAKHLRAMKQLACSSGVSLFEETPAIHIERVNGSIHVKTPRGSVRAAKVVIATNAFTHLLQGPVAKELSRCQSPMFARAAITEPLTEAQWSEIGWARRNAIESTLDLFHYFSPTADGRILFYWIYYGGHSRHGEMEPVMSAEGVAVSEQHLKRVFPSLKGVRVEQTWGGHMSGTRDYVPHLGFVGDDRVLYVAGCWGHGLAILHLHGQTISDLLRGVDSDLTDFWIIKRKPKKWPIAPFDYVGKSLAWNKMRARARRQLKGSIFE